MRLHRHILAPLFLLCAALPVGAQGVSGGKLPTRWDKDVSITSPLPEYPRPQMMRQAWQSLNGSWDYALSDKAVTTAPAAYDGHILVPYPYESALSGVGKASVPGQRLWYHRTFRVPAAWGRQHVLLHFGAVNWDSTISVNGQPIGAHRGGYDPFSFDITTALKPGANDLIVSAWNPVASDTADAQVLGKQRLHPGGIFYTAATGIWQTVWLEPVPAVHISELKITPDVDANVVHVQVKTDGPAPANVPVFLYLTEDDRTLALFRRGKAFPDITSASMIPAGKSNIEVRLPITKPMLWSPANPHLYGLGVTLGNGPNKIDEVDSYFAMRKISLGKDETGRTRIFLNNKFLFEVGALDQGYWPDGIYTAPTDEALRYDIETAKKLGLNLLRKHAKVEPERWYYWTDKLGMLVWQDMPQMFGGPGGALTDNAKQQFLTEWRNEINSHYNHPSIIVWTTFNEGWGQHDTEQIVALTKQLDPTRLVNDASGWVDKGVGDIHDTHAYPGPWSDKPEANRAAVNGEFGGVTMRVPDHMWTTDVMGYGATLKNGWLVTRRYQQLLKNAYGLRDTQGTSAVVYTQITDVEQESNGLMTYDRAVIKPDAAIVTAANEGRFLPLPPNPVKDILPTSQDEPATWRYTTDKPADGWFGTAFDDSGWKTGQGGFGKGVGEVHTPWTTSDIWLRREVTLPANLPDKLAFSVFHDEDVEIYVNGVLAASAPGYSTDYVSLRINEAGRTALKPGKNEIAVHVHQTVGGQFIDLGIIKGDG